MIPPKNPLKGHTDAMGAPLKSPEAKRDVRTAVMMTAIERAQLEERAGACGLTLSEFMRRQSLGRAMPAAAIDNRTRSLLATALLRLGVNLNQITRRMNAGRLDSFELPNLIADIRAHLERLTHESGRDRTG